MGSVLQSRKISSENGSISLNLSHPELIIDIHRQYITAGADAILTNTFAGSPFLLSREGIDGKTEDFHRVAVELAREAAAENVLVLGDIGPSGELIQPLGTVTESEMIEACKRQASALSEGGVDGFIIETMSDLNEALLALRAVREYFDGPVLVSLTFEYGPRGFHTVMGIDSARFAQDAARHGADAIGVNCGGIVIGEMVSLIRELRSETDLPLLAEPNAGIPELINGKTVFRDTPENMARLAPDLVEAGARMVGGCCGTTPEHIRQMKEAIYKAFPGGILES